MKKAFQKTFSAKKNSRKQVKLRKNMTVLSLEHSERMFGGGG